MKRLVSHPDDLDVYGKDATKLGHRDGADPVYRLILDDDGGITRVEQVPEEETLHALGKKKKPAKRLRKGMGR